MSDENDLQERRKKAAMGAKEIAEEIYKLAEPIDLEDLEKKGIIKKDGGWYIVPNMNLVPEGFSGLITEIAQSKDGIGARVKISLRAKKDYEKYAKILKRRGF